MNFGAIEEDKLENTEPTELTLDIEKVTVKSLLSKYTSAVGLDISKTGTGVIVWENDKYETYSIEIDMEVDLIKDDLAEEKMRLEYEGYLLELFEGKHFELVAIENVFGGKNFDTVRKLLALNSVMGELILKGKISADRVIKRQNQEWKKWLRSIYRLKNVNDKIEIEQALLHMEFEFAEKYHNESKGFKDKIRYQDILDATGVLCSAIIELQSNPTAERHKKLTMKNIEVTHLVDLSDIHYTDDKVINKFPVKLIDLNMSLEKQILHTINENSEENIVYAVQVPNSRLGTFGLSRDIPFYDQGYCVVVFYRKALKRL